MPKRLIILGIIAVALLLGLRELFAIHTIKVSAPSNVTEIQNQAQKDVAASWGQGSMLTLNSQKLVHDLMAGEPIIKSVKVVRHWPKTIELVVTLKQPSLGWSTGNQAYLLDRDGSVISPLPAGSTVATVVDDSNLPVELGQRVVTERFVGFTTAVVAGLKPLGLATTKLEVKDTTLDLYVTTAKGYYLVFDTSRNPADALADLKTIQAALSAQKKVPTQYVDLRITGKAYYK